MISFFRKIRLSLLNQSKVTRYLAYAFGEIFLVVIGILVALEVNNWNEEKKRRTFETDILSLLDNNLASDSLLMSKELTQAELANQLTDSLLNQVALGDYNEQLNLWMGKIISFQRFKSQSSAFEVLKSKGIENISDKALQLALIGYYDLSLFRVYQANSDVENAFNNDWVPIMKEKTSDFVYYTRIAPRNPKEFFESPSTVVLFKMYQDNRSGAIRRMEIALDEISHLRTQIKKRKL
ncbi:MAG: hypothetical protein ACJAZV_001399 [Roseivirga sp.]|jgi:hypothetical protein